MVVVVRKEVMPKTLKAISKRGFDINQITNIKCPYCKKNLELLDERILCSNENCKWYVFFVRLKTN